MIVGMIKACIITITIIITITTIIIIIIVVIVVIAFDDMVSVVVNDCGIISIARTNQ
tara:strand:+ start:498 stop:668 length:171 start_codon:yes stop_codon:yes gene_type:complete